MAFSLKQDFLFAYCVQAFSGGHMLIKVDATLFLLLLVWVILGFFLKNFFKKSVG